MKLFDEDGKESKEVTIAVYLLQLIFVVFILVHVILALPKIVHGWDGVIDYNMSTSGEDLAPDISIDTGTRETITDTVIIEPGYDIPITDSGGNTIEMEIINVMPTPAGIDQIEVFDYEANESMELDMNNR